MDNWKQWEQVYTRFDPLELRGVRSEWRVERPKSPVPDLLSRLRLPFGQEKVLLLGSVGAGKSSELRRMAESQPPARFVVVLDIYEHFSNILNDTGLLDRIAPWEVLFLVGLGLFRTGKDEGWFNDFDRETLEKAAQELQPSGSSVKIDVVKLASALGVGVLATAGGAMLGSAAGPAGTLLGAAGGLTTGVTKATEAFTFLKAVAEGFAWNLPLGQRAAPMPDRDSRTNRLIQAINQLIQRVRAQGWETVLVVDGLDRIKNRATAEHIFIESGLLGRLECRVVMGGPLLLAREGLAARVPAFTVKVLTEVPVIRQDVWGVEPVGQAFFRKLYDVRTADLSVQLHDAELERLALYSGGRVREFVTMIRTLSIQCFQRQLPVADKDAVDFVLDEHRRNLESGLRANHLRVLQAILDDPKHSLRAEEADADTVDQLLQRFWLLPYPNKSEWYHPHPLLTLEKLPLEKLPRPG